MIKKINLAQLKIVADSRQLVLDPSTGKSLKCQNQVSRKPKSIGTFIRKNDYKYSKGENHD